MEKLKVGDKVVLIRAQCGVLYTFSEVERLTNNTAILKNGIRLKNESDRYGFKQIGEKSHHWVLVTPKIIAAYELQSHEQKILNWFSKQIFTLEQKEHIFKLLNGER